MSLHLPSASALTRVDACPPSAVYPQADFTTSYGTHGDTVHRYLHNLELMDRETALAAIDPEDPAFAACEAIDVGLLPRGGRSEVALAWSCRTGGGRILGYNIGRRYLEHGLRADEFPGSADFLAKQDAVAVVVDYKTGYKVGPAKLNKQLRLLAAAGTRALGCTSARVAHLVLQDGRPPRWDIVEFDALQLLKIERELADLADRLDEVAATYRSGEQLDVRQGSWCRYCPAWDACPAKTAHAQALVAVVRVAGGSLARGPEVDALARLDSMTLEQLAEVVLQIEQRDQVRDRIMERLAERAEREPIPLGDGRVFKLAAARATEEVVDMDRALDILDQECGGAYSEMAMKAVTGKGMIEDAVRAWAKDKGRPIGKSKEAVLAELRRAGALKKVPGKVEARIVRED